MADILVATRNDSRSALDAQIDYLEEKYDGKIYHLSSPSIEISSNDIRKRCSNGSSIHFFLPEDVIWLYRKENDFIINKNFNDVDVGILGNLSLRKIIFSIKSVAKKFCKMIN